MRPGPRQRQHCRWFALLGALLPLSGCFGGLSSKAPAPQRYVLQPPAMPATTAAAGPGASAPPGGTLQVLRPVPAPGLGGQGIAVLRSGARLDDYENALWAADAPAALQGLLIEALRQSGHFAAVESDAGPFAAQYLLSLDLTHFEARYDGEGPPSIEVTLVASLGRRSDRSAQQIFTAHSSVRAQADRMQAVIAAFEQATGDVLRQLRGNLAAP